MGNFYQMKAYISVIEDDSNTYINLCFNKTDASLILTYIIALEFGSIKSMTIVDNEYPKIRSMKFKYEDNDFCMLINYGELFIETRLTGDQTEALKTLCIDAVLNYYNGLHIDFEDKEHPSYSYTIEFVQ